MNYIVAPLEITAREYEIYRLLYKRMDFKTFEVKYTLDQLVYDSDKIFDFSKRKVDVIIKKFIENGYLILLQKGVRGKPSIYKIVKINEQIRNEYVTNNELILNKLGTNNEQINVANADVEACSGTNNEQIMNKLGTNNEQICNEYVTPIKDKDKDKESIDQIWKLYPSKTGKSSAYKKIPKIIKEIGFDKLKECIENYIKEVEVKRKNGFKTLNYVNGSTFFNGRYIDYLEAVEIKEVKQVKSNLKQEIKEVDRETAFAANSAEDALAEFRKIINKEN